MELLVGDSRSNAEAGAQEVEALNEAGVVAIGGGFASGISLTATQAAARHDLPFQLLDAFVAPASDGCATATFVAQCARARGARPLEGEA